MAGGRFFKKQVNESKQHPKIKFVLNEVEDDKIPQDRKGLIVYEFYSKGKKTLTLKYKIYESSDALEEKINEFDPDKKEESAP